MSCKIREILTEQLEGLKIKAIIFTCFDLNTEFFENNVLPTIFNIEEPKRNIRKIRVNEQLAQSPCAVFYDASRTPNAGEQYYYQAAGIFVEGRLFHPKNIVVFGEKDGENVIFLSASSANLTISGWGRNEEVFSYIWITSSRQQAYLTLKKFLNYMSNKALRGYGNKIDALEKGIQFLKEIRDIKFDRDQDAELYFSCISYGDFGSFISANADRRWDELSVFSPYWGKSIVSLLNTFKAKEFCVFPAPVHEFESKIGISESKLQEMIDSDVRFYKKIKDDPTRFVHAKFYVLYGRNSSDRARVGIGSCNFTENGLSGKSGNVESMLVFETNQKGVKSFFANYEDYIPDDNAASSVSEEDYPKPLECLINVVLDWEIKCFMINFKWASKKEVSDITLRLPGQAMELKIKTKVIENKSIRFQPESINDKTYHLSYYVDGIKYTISGLVVELNLSFSTNTYFPPLRAKDIIDSWIDPELFVNKIMATSRNDSEDLLADTIIDETVSTNDDDIFNIYEVYKCFWILRKRLNDNRTLCDQYFIKRPDSILNLIKSMDCDDDLNVLFKHLVLMECKWLIADFKFENITLKALLKNQLNKIKPGVLRKISEERIIGTRDPNVVLDDINNNYLRLAWNYE